MQRDENIQFEDNYFDCTYCFASSWYFPDLYKSIDEMLESLKMESYISIFKILITKQFEKI